MTTLDLSTPSRTARLFWYRAHQRAVARARRLSAVYERAWRSGAPTFIEWEELCVARCRERFCYRQLCRVMDWW